MLFPATVLLKTDAYVREFLVRWGVNGPVSTAELHYALGRDLMERQPGCEQYSVVAAAAANGVPIFTSSPGDSSIGMNIAYHELMNDSRLMIDPNKDVNEVCAFILAGKKNGCVILGGGSPKNLQGQPTLWEVYGIPKGGNDYHPDHHRRGGGAACPAPRRRAVSWGEVWACCPAVAYATRRLHFRILRIRGGFNQQPPAAKELVHKRDARGCPARSQGSHARNVEVVQLRVFRPASCDGDAFL